MKKIILMGIACSLLGSAVAQVYSPSRYVSIKTNKVPKPNGTVDLVLSISPKLENDDNSNGLLDANEHCRVRFKIKNNGTGTAYKLLLSIKQEKNVNGVSVSYNKEIGNLSSRESKEIVFDILANEYVGNKTENLKISISEGNGFDADPSIFSFQTQAFKYPQLVVADYKFSSDQGKTLKLGDQATLEIIVQNTGQGQAKEVNIHFKNPENVFPQGEDNFNVNSLAPGETHKISYSFLVNKKYKNSDVLITVKVTESYAKYGEERDCSIRINQALAKTNQVKLEGTYAQGVIIPEASLESDVDRDIPESASENDHRYAVIIGNEDYSSYQTGLSSEVNVDFAQNDAQVFAQYCQKTLGIPEKQIKVLVNATSGKMKQALNWLKEATNIDPEAEVFFYYSGHGLPNEQSKEAYLMPVDISGNQITEGGLKVSDVYQGLSNSNPKRATVFLDACFSGGARNQPLLARKAARVKPQAGLIQGNMVVFASSSGDESSGVYREKQHGYFTYFLLKKLQETSGNINYKELSDYLKNTVSKETFVSDKKQTPNIQASPEATGWEGWSLK